MKGNVKIFGIAVLVMAMGFVFAGRAEAQAQAMTGTYEWENPLLPGDIVATIEFTGTNIITYKDLVFGHTASGTYSVRGNRLTIRYPLVDGRQRERTFTLSADKSSFTGSSATFRRAY